jgi:uncharacterized protein
MAYSDRYLLFIEYFNKEKYMSAQTTLDEIWLDEKGSDKDFYGGLIQVAVAMYHLTNENPKGAKKVYEKARSMLSPYGSNHHGVNLGKLLTEFDSFLSTKVDYENLQADYRNQIPRIQFQEEKESALS